VTVTAPPRPSHPVDREELEALVEALIEEARQRQRRRRRMYLAVAGLVGLAAIAVVMAIDRTTGSQSASSALAATSGPAGGPTSSRLAFLAALPKTRLPKGVHAQWEVYVMNADGSGKRRLALTYALSMSPVWSPDGQKLAFEQRLDPTKYKGQCGGCDHEIFVMNADGSGQQNLTRDVAYDGNPAWSPDGQTIAFSSARDKSTIPTLYVMNADGSGLRRVTQDAADAWGPAWSPDGRRIAFGRVVGGVGNDRDGDVFVVHVDGSGLLNLTRNPAMDHSATWSPDGRRIAFVSYRDGHPAIYVMNADGAAQRKLTRTPHGEGSPAWSPDGRKIAFVRWPLTRPPRKWGRDEEVYVVNVDGTGLRNLTRSPGRDTQPVWSPDGRTIGFVSWRDGNSEIYVTNANGSGLRNLTRGFHQQAFGIAWSPVQK
jgi:Tol biopolymer transport system component